MDWAQSDTYFVPPTWRCIVKNLIQFHEKEAAELVEKLKMPDRYNFSYSTKDPLPSHTPHDHREGGATWVLARADGSSAVALSGAPRATF